MFDVIPITTDRHTACGPASLKMLLDYYGQEASLDALIRECGVSITGCSGADMLRAGRAHGLDMTAWSMSADELLRQDRPAVIHWRGTHWAVFCGVDADGRPAICNPSRGRYRMSREQFAGWYSGTALFNGTPQPLDVFPADYFGEHNPEPVYFDN